MLPTAPLASAEVDNSAKINAKTSLAISCVIDVWAGRRNMSTHLIHPIGAGKIRRRAEVFSTREGDGCWAHAGLCTLRLPPPLIATASPRI
jgi:hypothetical protein